MSDTEGTTPALLSATPRRSTCPAWCDDHEGFADGSGDWHKSRDRVVDDRKIYLSTGTVTGAVKVFMDDESVALDAAEAWANLILETAAIARGSATSLAPDGTIEFGSGSVYGDRDGMTVVLGAAAVSTDDPEELRATAADMLAAAAWLEANQ